MPGPSKSAEITGGRQDVPPLSAPARRARRTRTERAAVVALFESSGMLPGEFCKAQGLSEPSFYRWRAEVREGVSAAPSKRSGRRMALENDSEAAAFVMGRMVRQPGVRATHLQREMVSKFGIERTPSQGAIRNFMRRTRGEHGAALAKMSNPREFKNRWKPAFGAHRDGVQRANEIWEIDSTPSDVLTEGGRANLVGILDVATRRLCIHVSATSDSNAVAACIRKAVIQFGAPECIVSDNGKDYVSEHIRGALARLGIRHEKAPFRAPEMKPCIERAFGTLTRDLFERMENYTGHNVAEHKDIIEMKRESERRTVNGRILRLHEKRLDLIEFGEVIDQWIQNGYEHRPHAGLGGKTPTEKTQELIESVRMIPERALDILLMKSATRIVGRGGVRLGGLEYIHEELGRFINARVEVRSSDDELGAVFCFEENGRFICRAENAAAVGVRRQEIARAARQKQKARNDTAIEQFGKMAGALDKGEILRDIREEKQGAQMSARPVTVLSKPIAEAMKASDKEAAAGVPLSEAEERAAAAFDNQ